MLDRKFRKILPDIVKPLIHILNQSKITPNQLSLLAFCLACLASYLLSQEHQYWALGVWYLGRLCDGLDGILARDTSQVSPWGGYIDICLDMSAYGIMLIGFAYLYSEYSLLWLGIMFGYVLCITTTLALSSILESHQSKIPDNDRSLQFTSGIAEASETSIAYTLFVLLPGFIEIWGGGLVIDGLAHPNAQKLYSL